MQIAILKRHLFFYPLYFIILMKQFLTLMTWASLILFSQVAMAQNAPQMSSASSPKTINEIPVTGGTVAGKVTIKDCDGNVVWEDSDPSATCAAWTAWAQQQPSANYLLNNHECSEGRMTFHTTACVERWFSTQNFTRAQFFQLLAQRAANPQAFDRSHCTERAQTVKVKGGQ